MRHVLVAFAVASCLAACGGASGTSSSASSGGVAAGGTSTSAGSTGASSTSSSSSSGTSSSSATSASTSSSTSSTGSSATTGSGSSASSGSGGGISFQACPASPVPANSKQLAGFSGGFYVITEQDDAGYSSVIRYTGSGCNVQPDSSFDAGPVLWDWGGGTQNIAADSAGELFVTATYTTDIFGPTGELQGQVPVWAQNLNISGDGTMFTEAFVGTPQRFLRVDDGGFVQDPAFAPQGFTFVGGTLSLSADRVVIGSSPSFQAPWQLFFLDGSGADAGAFGNTATPFASDGFCWISQILDCGGGNLCVVDTNCAQVSVWSSSGVELAYGSPPGGQLRSAAVDGSGSLWVLVSDLSTGGVILERATGVP